MNEWKRRGKKGLPDEELGEDMISINSSFTFLLEEKRIETMQRKDSWFLFKNERQAEQPILVAEGGHESRFLLLFQESVGTHPAFYGILESTIGPLEIKCGQASYEACDFYLL